MALELQSLLLLVLLVCSGMISASETALFALSGPQLRSFAESRHRFKLLVARLMRRPRTVLVTVLLSNTVVNVAFFAASLFLLEELAHTRPLVAGVGVVLVPFTLVLCGEVLPKAVALAHAGRLAPVCAVLIQVLSLVLAPVRGFLEYVVVSPLTRLILPGRPESPRVSTEELRALVEMSAHQGVINVRENEMLQQIVMLPEVSVRTIMVPRVDIVAVPLAADRVTVAARVRESGRKKIPVYGENLDDIRGLIYAVDLHLHGDRPPADLLRPVHVVPEQASLLQLLRELRRQATPMAIVVDEYGGTAGLVALEDVLEWIVGDITDADEASGAPTVEVLSETSYRLSGDISVRMLADYFGVRPAAEGIETLGGFMLAHLGRPPRVGDVVRTANLKLIVERVSRRRVASVRVELVDPAEEGGLT